jgi:hypothetical protein
MIRSRRMRWAGHLAHMGEMRNAYNIFVGKLKGKRLLRRCRCRWEDNIKMDLREIEFRGMDWIHPTQDRDWWQALVNMVRNL